MIFNVPGHIGMIHNGTKTQTRRINRGIYQEGKDYAVQPKRGIKAVEYMRIVMDKIWEEYCCTCIHISGLDALAEGGYYPIVFEEMFRAVNPKWDGRKRWAYMFHAIEV